jgi:mono/diheme cytochrome c family protein
MNHPLILIFALIAADNVPPVARWDFGTEETAPLAAKGNVQRDQAGPRPPEFPGMAENNLSVRLDADAYLTVPDTGLNSVYDFTNGDAITVEAWVNPSVLREGHVGYVVGKGRTGSPKFTHDNQNWSMRVVGAKNEARLSFLFATKLSSSEAHWHRWDSKLGFTVGTGWHHIAIAYRFDDPKSIRGWINGKPTLGAWSFGGETKEPPVVDDDEVRIGSGFEGLLDGIAIHRAVLEDKVVASRFHRVGEPRIIKAQTEVMPQLDDIPDGCVLVQLCEGLPAHNRWLNEGEQWPAESIRWTGDTFLLERIPLQYDAWGIRSAWNAPVLLRMAGDVELPAGTQRFLLRGRSQGRLWINGKVVARTEPVTKRPPDGEEPVTPLAVAPLDGVRVHGYHQQEVFAEATIEPGITGKSRVVMELVVGGKGHRTETGEVCVAMLSADGKTYQLLGTGSTRLPLTDAAVEPALSSMEKSLAQLDDQRRRDAAASQHEFWQKRHEIARTWVKETSRQETSRQAISTAGQAFRPVRNTKIGKSAHPGDTHPIDGFITSKIERAVAAAKDSDARQSEHFHGKVLPILREHCFRCHGEKDKSGLKLDSREALLKAGDSEIPAVVPGDLEASELIKRIRSGDMPPTEESLSGQQIELLEQWVKDRAPWPAPPLTDADVVAVPVIDDAAFMRRIYLDTIGIPPREDEARAFLANENPTRRSRLIQDLIKDERFSDGWMNFWLDLLAENPTLINASLNSTGPFRWFLHDALRDNKPLDRMVTELIMMRGGAAEGGSAGFGIAAENDAPLAAKGHIVASAFLGIELQCARCHDSPYHSTTQKDLYSIAALFNRKPVSVPMTSQVPAAFFENQKIRKSLIQVTLEANASVHPEWPFATVTGISDGPEIDRLMQHPADTRERLAALITAPQNIRFARVIVNRIWKRLMGAGLVEPVHDWQGGTASHPQLLDWLARALVANDYDLRHVVRLIVTSDTYQRAAVGKNLAASAAMRFFNAPERRRLSAEQIVDSLHHATGRPIDVEELTFVHDGRRELGQRQTLGKPTRAWMFGDLKNERDRPSLSLPRARAVVDVLEAFGWTGARQVPIAEREIDPNVLQPGILANGTLSASLTRASYQSEMADLAVAATSPEWLVDSMFLRYLSRWPQQEERTFFAGTLSEGFDTRLVPVDKIARVEKLPSLPQVTWFNHGRAEANEIQLEIERRVLAGPPPDPRLSTEWRTVYEDTLWSLITHREFVWLP